MMIDCATDRFFHEVIDGNEYSYLFKDLVVMDVGCNVGTFSLWIYQMAKKIYAIDIASGNISALNETIQKNHLDKILTYNCGIGGGSGQRYVEKTGSAEGGSWHITDKKCDDMIQVYSVNDFFSRESIDHIDVLKLDVEGAETEILESRDFPYKRISTIIGETHSNRAEGVHITLRNMGYSVTGDSGHFLAKRL